MDLCTIFFLILALSHYAYPIEKSLPIPLTGTDILLSEGLTFSQKTLFESSIAQEREKRSPTELIKVEDGVYASPKDPATVAYPTYTFPSSTTQEKGEESSPATVVPDAQSEPSLQQPSSPTYTLPPINHEKNLHSMTDARQNPYWQQRGHTWGEAARKNAQRHQMHEEALHYQAETMSLLSQPYIRDQVERKMAAIIQALEKALDICDAYVDQHKTPEAQVNLLARRISLFDVEIPDRFFNNLWINAQYDITKAICDKDGMMISGVFGEVKKFEAIMQQFQEDIGRHFESYKGELARHIAHNTTMHTPHEDTAKTAWLATVRNNTENKKLLAMHTLINDGNFAQAHQLVEEAGAAVSAENKKGNYTALEKVRNHYIVLLGTYLRHYKVFYDEYGVRKEFSNHPAYASVTKNLAVTAEPRNDLNEFFEHATFIEQHLNSYQSDKVIDKDLYEARKQALRTYYMEGDARRVTTVNLSEIGKQCLADHGIYPPKFLTMEANALQRQAQQEFKNITEKAAVLHKGGHKELAPILQLNAHLLEVGVEYTLGQNIAQAQVIADCCNTILDNKEAIAQGAIKGVVGIGQYMYDHPVETAMTLYAPGFMLPYRATKMTLEALGYTYNRLSRVDYKTLTTQKVFDKFEKIYKDFEDLPTSVKFREGTALGVQILLDGRITDGVGKGARAVLKKASETISKIEHPAVVGVLAAASKAQQKVPVRNDHLAHMNESHSVPQHKTPSISAPSVHGEQSSTKSLSQFSKAEQATHIDPLKQTLIQRAIQKEQEFLKANAGLPRTIERAKEELAMRVARLEMQYGKETAQEALSLFNTSDRVLEKNVLLTERLEDITAGLHKINSNSRWSAWKYDMEKGGKITIGSVEEALAAIACEQQGLLSGLIRSPQEGADFMQIFSQKKGWDVKTAPTYSLDGKYIFDAKIFVKSIIEELRGTESVILDITKLNAQELNSLVAELKTSLNKNQVERVLAVNIVDNKITIAANQLLHT